MARVTTVINLWTALAKIEYEPANGYSCLTMVSAAEMTEQGWQPAESFTLALSKERRDEFIAALTVPEDKP